MEPGSRDRLPSSTVHEQSARLQSNSFLNNIILVCKCNSPNLVLKIEFYSVKKRGLFVYSEFQFSQDFSFKTNYDIKMRV